MPLWHTGLNTFPQPYGMAAPRPLEHDKKVIDHHRCGYMRFRRDVTTFRPLRRSLVSSEDGFFCSEIDEVVHSSTNICHRIAHLSKWETAG